MDIMDGPRIELRDETSDRSMLVLQYVIAVTAILAAILLPFLH
jgi:hypothetical protein